MSILFSRLFILLSFFGSYQNAEIKVISDTNNIYYAASREYIFSTKELNESDTILVLNKSKLLLPTKIGSKTIIQVGDDYQMIHNSFKNAAFEIFPKKWKVFYTEVSILNFYIEEDILTIYGSASIIFRRRLLFGNYRFLKIIRHSI